MKKRQLLKWTMVSMPILLAVYLVSYRWCVSAWENDLNRAPDDWTPRYSSNEGANKTLSFFFAPAHVIDIAVSPIRYPRPHGLRPPWLQSPTKTVESEKDIRK